MFVSLLLIVFWVQGFWVPIPLMIINIYTIAAFIVHYVIKRSLTTPILSVWTGFLVLSFISTILQVYVFLPSEFWILLIPIGAYLVFAILYTVFYGLSKE